MFDFKKDPLENFLESFEQAQKLIAIDVNAMTLSTSENNKPFSRIVLYKGLIREGFSFFTHYNRLKGRQLESNPQASLVFYWQPMGLQVRVYGDVFKLTMAESDQYFSSRPRLSQLGAWVSKQSEDLKSFDQFNHEMKLMDQKYSNQVILRPETWGGYHVVPLEIEFWFSRPGRLHERYVYFRDQINQAWQRKLRYP